MDLTGREGKPLTESEHLELVSEFLEDLIVAQQDMLEAALKLSGVMRERAKLLKERCGCE